MDEGTLVRLIQFKFTNKPFLLLVFPSEMPVIIPTWWPIPTCFRIELISIDATDYIKTEVSGRQEIGVFSKEYRLLSPPALQAHIQALQRWVDSLGELSTGFKVSEHTGKLTFGGHIPPNFTVEQITRIQQFKKNMELLSPGYNPLSLRLLLHFWPGAGSVFSNTSSQWISPERLRHTNLTLDSELCAPKKKSTPNDKKNKKRKWWKWS